jgi:DNA-binding Lrp family transcriptional regulator
MAEEDVRRVADALRVSPQEVERVLRQLTKEGVGDSQDQDCHLSPKHI